LLLLYFVVVGTCPVLMISTNHLFLRVTRHVRTFPCVVLTFLLYLSFCCACVAVS
jgi:hypothetical protein